MKLDIINNTKKGIIYGTISTITTTVLPFAVRTVLIKTIGIEYAGVQGLFTSILTAFSLAELGIGSAIVYSMYKPIAYDDIPLICALLKLYKKTYNVIGLVILCAGICTLPFLQYLVKGSYPPTINIKIIFTLYLINTVLSYWLFAYKKSLLTAYQRTDVMSIITLITQLITNISQIIILTLFRNFYIYSSIAIVSTIINNLLTSVVVDRMFPEIHCHGQIDQIILKDIKTKVLGAFIGKICGITRNTFDTIFISMFLGLTSSAIYSNYYLILGALNSFTSVILTSLLGGIGNNIALSSPQKNFDEMIKFNQAYLIVSCWISTCMLCLYQPFMVLWVGKDLLLPDYIMFLFPLYFYILKMGDIRSVYAEAAGLYWEDRWRNIAETIANIVLNYLFITKFGITGVLLATIFTVFFIGFLGSTQVIFRHYFHSGKTKYLLDQIELLLFTICFSFGIYYICINLTIYNQLYLLLLRTLICTLILPFLLFILQKKYNNDIILMVIRNKNIG